MDRMRNIIKKLVIWKFRFDQVASFLSYINFSLLIITSAPNVQKLVGGNTSTITILMFVIGISILLIMSWVLDTKIKYFQHMQSIQNERNPQITEILENTRKIMREKWEV